MTTMLRRPNRGWISAGAAAIMLMVAADASQAQSVNKEEREETAIENETRHSVCTEEDPIVNGRREVRTRTQNNPNNFRTETRIKEWANGFAIPSGNKYQWNLDSMDEIRSSETSFSLRLRNRTRLLCSAPGSGQCMPAPGQPGDDEFFEQRERLEVRNGVVKVFRAELTQECK
jgi:hypothetical protein